MGSNTSAQEEYNSLLNTDRTQLASDLRDARARLLELHRRRVKIEMLDRQEIAVQEGDSSGLRDVEFLKLQDVIKDINQVKSTIYSLEVQLRNLGK
jgi:hypothetical protein